MFSTGSLSPHVIQVIKDTKGSRNFVQTELTKPEPKMNIRSNRELLTSNDFQRSSRW
jgi:hypothetical protein